MEIKPASKVNANERQRLLAMYDFDAYSRQPVSFYFSQSGFACDGHKPVIVWTTAVHRTATAFRQSEDGACQDTLPITDLGINLWGRQEWLVDLSELTTPLRLRIVVKFDSVQAVSPLIIIRDDCYERLMEKAAKHYHLKQCGIYCHEHDANCYALSAEKFGALTGKVPAHGGWHDAHDDNKWVPFVWMPLYGLLKTHEFMQTRRPASAGKQYSLLEEAQWEIEWLLRMQKEDGSFYYAVFEWNPQTVDGQKYLKVWDRFDYDDVCDDRRALIDCWGRDVINRLIGILGRPGVKAPSTAPKYFAYVAHNFLHFARLARSLPGMAQTASRCLDGANRAMDYVMGLKVIPEYQALEVEAALTLCLLERYRLSNCDTDLRDAERRIQCMLDRQQAEGHFHSSGHCRGLEWYPEETADERVIVDYPFGYMFALIEYIELSRTTASSCRLVQPAGNALRRFASLLATLCNHTNFHQMVEPCIGHEPAIIIPVEKTGHGYNPLILSAGAILAAAGRLLSRPEWTMLAEAQLYWVLGCNPRFMSFMNDEGVRNSGTYAGGAINKEGVFNLTASYRHQHDFRWGITTGIYGGKSNSPNEGTGVDGRDVPNYPNAGRAADGQYDCKAQETWLNATGWFLRLLVELTAESRQTI